MTQHVRWGILGTGRITEKVGPAIQACDRAALVAIASRSAERAAEWAHRHAIERHFGSYAALLDDPQVDAVYIALPPSLHAKWTIRAAERGKHVLCEKPLAHNLAEACEMESACRQQGVQLMDGVMWVHHPRAAAMKQVLTDGMLGDLRRVTSAFTFRWEQPPTNEYRLDRLLGGGSLLDLGWYNVGVTLWAFEALPQRVSATARWHGGVDHSLDATLWFDDVRRASFDCGFDVPLRKWGEIAGTHGSLVCDDFTRPWTEDRPRFWRHDSGGKVTEQLIPGPKQEVCLIDTFCRLVQAGQLDASWPRRSIEVQQVCDALERSARTGKVTEFMGLKRDAEIVVGP